MSSFDPDSFITRQLAVCFESDFRIPDIFSLLQHENPEYDEDIAYCANPDAYFHVTQEILKEHPYIPKDQIIFHKFDYPESIKKTIEDISQEINSDPESDSKKIERFFLGYFPLADFFYFVTDNNLILFDSKGTTFQIVESDTKVITSCEIALPDKSVYETDKVNFLLIYSTYNSITVLPVGKTCDKIYEKGKKTISISFMPTIIKAYPTETSSYIFIGSNDGDVYGLFYKFNQVEASIDITIENLTTNKILSLIPKFLRYTNSIIDISYDVTTCTLAAVDSSSNIFFYKYDLKKKLTKVSKYDKSPVDGEKKEEIISINEIPISDSEYFRFICITKNGERLLFGTNPGTFKNDEILRLNKMYPPRILLPQIKSDPLISGAFYLNYSMFVSQQELFVFHSYYHPHQPITNPVEFFHSFDFESENTCLLNIIVPSHKYQTQTFRHFYHELLWEHIQKPPVFYLMCSTCYYKLTLSRPVDALRQLITESKGSFSIPVKEWMNFYGEEAESPATLLQLASEHIESQIECRRALNILYQYSSMKTNQLFKVSTYQLSSVFNDMSFEDLSPACAGFIQRTAKLLAPIWQTTVFIQDENGKYCLSPVFKKVCKFKDPKNTESKNPRSLEKQLENLIKLTEEYTAIKRTLSPSNKTAIQKKDEVNESKFFERLKNYLEKIIKMLTFISIISKQDIDHVMSSIRSESAKKRLSIDFFGSDIKQITLYDALQEFADALLIIDPNIYQQFDGLCLDFFSFENRQIIDVTSRLESNTETTSLLEEALETYLRYIDKHFKLSTIVKLFKRGKFVKGVIDVCLRKAKACDPNSIALQWFKKDRSSEDSQGRYYFDLRYKCYEHLFDLIEENGEINLKNIEQMLTSEDELFHICLYDKMLRMNHINELLSFTSHYIEPFLDECAPDLKWIYSSRHKEYIKSAKQLLEIIYDRKKDFTLDQRIAFLKNVKQLSNAGGDTDLMDEVDMKLKFAEAQLDLNKAMKELYSDDDNDQPIKKYILDDQDLVDYCCKNFQWDSLLKILSFCSISEDGSSIRNIISETWSNYFRDQLWAENDRLAIQRIKKTCEFIKEERYNEVCDPSITMPVFEEHRLKKKFYELWAVDAMLTAGFDKDLILEAYLKVWPNKDLSQAEKLDFCYAIAYLVHYGAKKDGIDRDLKDVKDYFLNKGVNYKHKTQAAKYMKKF